MDSSFVISTSQYELTKIILDFIGIIVWPLMVFILVLIFKKELKKILLSAKKIGIPGGVDFEIENKIEEAEKTAEKIKTEKQPVNTPKSRKINNIEDGTEINRKMAQLGLDPSPSGLDLNFYRNIANEYSVQLASLGLRLDLELMLRNLLKGFKIVGFEKKSVSQVARELFSKGRLTENQLSFVLQIFQILNSVAHGAEITYKQFNEVLNIGQILIEDYKNWLDWNFPKQ